MKKNIAILLTCHNRKEKTVDCLNHLFRAFKKAKENVEIKIFLTDDGSTDGTSEIIKQLFHDVIILKGNGKLFWAGGMRNSWNEALRFKFDLYLLLNDDTNVFDNLFKELLSTQQYAMDTYKIGGIYIGSTLDNANNFSYGGARVKSKFLNTYIELPPDGSITTCDLGNANIMMVSNEVVSKIGILSNLYTHALADYDYTLWAKRKKIPVLVAAHYCGVCNRNHEDKYKIFANLSFGARRNFLIQPKGLALLDEIKFMKKFYPYRLPFIYVTAAFKLLFPKAYIALHKLR